jgi:hypothetical protein
MWERKVVRESANVWQLKIVYVWYMTMFPTVLDGQKMEFRKDGVFVECFNGEI